ncbi:hypothetical protein [Actinophytocola oryzae]|uniref:Uncharacterized protein n=1 Tax=Actinophytocola oryzae TaxID=502181 RepID=A0A4R7UR50_9PSEU|nr:hypothetical protein [Actinophytocola oryzae]TDV35930.1 hypothetical protein CLV71_13326 [Actinophytocola oryzae]
MALTPAAQRNAVSEGIALGLVACGRDALPADKGRLGAAFETTWLSWVHRVRFPQIETDLSDGADGVSVMTGADDPKEAWALYWEHRGGEFLVNARQGDWSPEDRADLDYAATVIGGDLPVADWAALAGEFLRHLEV